MYQDLDEQRLAGLCSENDRCAQEELYTRYAARLLALCRRYSDSPEDAWDLMQDSIIKALGRISTFRYAGKGSLYAWISRVAVNTAISNIRKHHLRFVRFDAFVHDKVSEPMAEDFSLISQEVLLDIISGLPETQRAIFNMFCLDGYSHKEIAKVLGISEKGSASLLAKAKRLLKKRIKDYIVNSG